jgi:N-formylglutamate amidohydrolase
MKATESEIQQQTFKPIILHIPHASTYIPINEGYVGKAEEISNEINLLTDWYTDAIFDLSFTKIIAPVSRVFCDVERFPDDSQEVMSEFGMGMCYTHFDNGKPMRNASPALREKIKTEYYDPHHRRLETAVEAALDKHGQALIIDCHSFPDIPLNRDLRKEIPRPDFCIGTDDYHTPREVRKAFELILSYGYTVELNTPYSGSIVPLRYFNKNKNVKSIMIEVNRRLYQDAIKSKKPNNSEVKVLRNMLKELLTNII